MPTSTQRDLIEVIALLTKVRDQLSAEDVTDETYAEIEKRIDYFEQHPPLENDGLISNLPARVQVKGSTVAAFENLEQAARHAVAFDGPLSDVTITFTLTPA